MCIRDRSMAIGLLMGNCNLVRVSFGQEAMRVAEAFCAPFARVLEKKCYRHLADRMAVVTYPKKNETLTIRYSEKADLRIIWGGDAAVSYTHLDVYKRQCLYIPDWFF